MVIEPAFFAVPPWLGTVLVAFFVALLAGVLLATANVLWGLLAALLAAALVVVSILLWRRRGR